MADLQIIPTIKAAISYHYVNERIAIDSTL
jgi:hypothetical protein